MTRRFKDIAEAVPHKIFIITEDNNALGPLDLGFTAAECAQLMRMYVKAFVNADHVADFGSVEQYKKFSQQRIDIESKIKEWESMT